MLGETGRRNRRRVLCTLVAGGLAWPAVGRAQTWPTRPVRIVVPFSAGGTTDVLARLIATHMTQGLGQSVVVENRPGVGGLLGADQVAKAEPDGYTLLMANISFPLSVLMAARENRLNFEPQRDLQGISIVAGVPMVLTANADVAANNLKEFTAQVLRDSATHYTFGSTGPGSFMHAIGAWLQQETGAPLTHIPFKGAAPLKQNMLAGRIHLGGDQLSTSLGEIRAGLLKAMAVTSSKRSAMLPDVPTVRELGFAGIEVEGWNGLLAPGKTPQDVVARIQQSVFKAVNAPAVHQRILDMAAEPMGSSPAEQTALINAQLTQFRPIVTQLKLE